MVYEDIHNFQMNTIIFSYSLSFCGKKGKTFFMWGEDGEWMSLGNLNGSSLKLGERELGERIEYYE